MNLVDIKARTIGQSAARYPILTSLNGIRTTSH
jgi:hypothetical protein